MAARQLRAARRSSKSTRPGFGSVPDLPDRRDVLYGAVQPVPARLPQSADLRPHCSPFENQGALGSCIGNAIAGAVEFLERKDGVHFVNVSRLLIYCRAGHRPHHQVRCWRHDP
jgi:hypothetical protein